MYKKSLVEINQRGFMSGRFRFKRDDPLYFFIVEIKKPFEKSKGCDNRRGGKIRTCDLLVPNQAR